MEVKMYNYRDFKIPYDIGIEIDREVDAEIKKKQHTEIGGLSKISELLRVWKWLGFNFILEYISGSILLFVVGFPLFVGIAMTDSVCKRQVFKDSTLQKLTGWFFPDEKKFIQKKMSKKNYMIPVNCIDCPIEVKKDLLDMIDSGFVYLNVGLLQNPIRYFKESGDVERLPQVLSVEYDFFKSQLEPCKLYKIADIITDIAKKKNN